MVLTAVNVVGCYWSISKYARYFARRYPKVAKDEKGIEVLNLDESSGVERKASVAVDLQVTDNRRPVLQVSVRLALPLHACRRVTC